MLGLKSYLAVRLRLAYLAAAAALGNASSTAVTGAAAARQQRTQTSLQHHEQARPARARKLQQPSIQRPAQPRSSWIQVANPADKDQHASHTLRPRCECGNQSCKDTERMAG
jgi:hypothetical protein